MNGARIEEQGAYSEVLQRLVRAYTRKLLAMGAPAGRGLTPPGDAGVLSARCGPLQPVALYQRAT